MDNTTVYEMLLVLPKFNLLYQSQSYASTIQLWERGRHTEVASREGLERHHILLLNFSLFSASLKKYQHVTWRS